MVDGSSPMSLHHVKKHLSLESYALLVLPLVADLMRSAGPCPMFDLLMAVLRFAKQLVSTSLVKFPPAGPAGARANLGRGVVSSVVPVEVWTDGETTVVGATQGLSQFLTPDSLPTWRSLWEED
jgi:hypothetical protein